MSPANQTRRQVMLIAHDLRRGDLAQPFAACLRGAWKFIKALAAFNPLRARQTAGLVTLAPTLIRSPIARATRSHRYGGGQADYKAGRMTARLGA
jgi:hypothetical protein